MQLSFAVLVLEKCGCPIFFCSMTTERIQALEYPVFLGATLEYGNVLQEDNDIEFDEGLLTGSVFLGADTPIGPLYLNVGATQTKGFSALLSLGLTF